MELRIRLYPENVLRTKASDVVEFDDGLRLLVEKMFRIMYENKGIGLAANQVGILKRIAVVDVYSDRSERGKNRLVLINPMVLEAEGEDIREEGCLSLPGLYKSIKRPFYIKLRAQDERGNFFEMDAEDMLARVIQHEVDHLNGVVFVDRLPPLARRLALEKYKKLRKQALRRGK